MYTCMFLRCTQTGPEVWEMDGWMIQMQAPSSGETQELIWHNPSALWVFSSRWVYISCTLVIVVHYEIEWVHLILSNMVSDTLSVFSNSALIKSKMPISDTAPVFSVLCQLIAECTPCVQPCWTLLLVCIPLQSSSSVFVWNPLNSALESLPHPLSTKPDKRFV